MLPSVESFHVCCCDKYLSFSRAGKNFTICQGDKEKRGELLAIRRLPWQTTQEEKNGGGDAERKTDSGEEREIEGGEEKVGNPLKYVLKPLCRAQPGNRHINRPAPERRLCNQSLPSSTRQLPAPTGGQLGRVGRMEGRETESEVGENRICGQKHRWWLPVECTCRQEGECHLWTAGGRLDGPKWRRNYGDY